jgi:predicted GNAT family acetyltransferase
VSDPPDVPPGAAGGSGPRVEIRDNPAAGRYEIALDDRLIGVADYLSRGEVRVLHHTETFPGYGGRGFANRLVEFAMSDAAARGLRVDPVCSFVAEYLRRHPQFEHLRI